MAQAGTTPQAEAVPSLGLPFQQVAPIFALTFVDVLGLTVILPLLHLYAAAYGASPLEIGLVASAFPLAQLVGVPLMGALSDRFGRKPLLLISQITTFVSFILLGLADSLALIVFSRVLDGIFGANFSTAQAALSDVTDESNRARGLGITGAAFGLGFLFGPFIALITLEMTDSLAVPALSAAGYSFLSILLTAFWFKETLPPEKRGGNISAALGPLVVWHIVRVPGMALLLLLIFMEQIVFYGFEALMGVFTLSRLGILGQGNALFFLFIGSLLVYTQVRLIGRWTARYGEARVVWMALALLALGLLLVALTPEIPQPFYVARNLAFDLRQQAPNSTEAIIGSIGVRLPREGHNGLGGILWFLVAIIPLSIGAGLIRPCLNSLMTKRVGRQQYGAVLGVSASLVSAANAAAPILGGLLMQAYGVSLPFLLGAGVMALLALLAAWRVRPIQTV
ncbi:MAG: MFS transporter [Anaerolineae bacterium]|nr:MFS transporter [Anaerolineae bacterium]MDW8173581.1 MFS transporter [Anaerolineae bacterium]